MTDKLTDAEWKAIDLDYQNNFLTALGFASYYDISDSDGADVIKKAKKASLSFAGEASSTKVSALIKKLGIRSASE